jgi:predicted O-methyltransferase YrrM
VTLPPRDELAVNETARLVGMFVRATEARRVLEIGTGTAGCGLVIAGALPPTGTLITLERNKERAARARRVLAEAGHTDRVAVIAADAGRYLHKVAGPFDIVLQHGDVSQYELLHDRLVLLLAPAATLITAKLHSAGGYNEVLGRDGRLNTTLLDVGGGIAVSVLAPERRGDTNA